jgi:hypothetical protein
MGGIERARASIDSGRAKNKLDALARFTQECRNFSFEEFWFLTE